MSRVADWWIQTLWWASGIFATGALWYFLSTREYWLAFAAALAAILFALLAIVLHKKKDALAATASSAQVAPMPPLPAEKDKIVTSEWWNASDLKKEYEGRGWTTFRWSNVDRVPEREQEGYKVVVLRDPSANMRYRLVNRSGQVLVAKA